MYNTSQTKVKFENPHNLVYERKFDTAMRQSQVDKFLLRVSNPDSMTIEDRVLFSMEMFPDDTRKLQIRPSLHARFLNNILSMRPYNTAIRNQTTRINRLVKQNLQIQMSRMISTINIPSWRQHREKQLHRYLDELSYPIEIENLIHTANQLSDVINRLNDSYDPSLRKLDPESYVRDMIKINRANIMGMLELRWNRDFCLFKLEAEIFLLPRVYILMIHNKICDLISILILCISTKGKSLDPDIFRIVLSLVQCMSNLILKYENDYFSISKVIEGLCYAETLVRVETWKNIEFLNEISKELQEEVGFCYEGSALQSILTSVDDPTRHELACLSKILGHPLVDMRGGSLAIHKKTTEVYSLNPETLATVECYIKQNYIRNHIANGQGWPPHEIHFQAPKQLKLASLLNLDPESDYFKKKYGSILITHYLFVDILPNLKFNKLENIIPYLKDKTISLTRSKLFNKVMEEQTDNKRGAKWEETRLLLAYLLNPSFVTDHTRYLDQLDQGVPLDHFLDYLVCRIVPKEKEHKVKFRGFGCKPLHDRMRSLVQEINSKHYLDLFSDEQAMTLTELQLVKKLYSFRCLKDAYTGHEVLYITIDASSWNNHFRKETVDDMMINTLSKIYNHNIFSRTHECYLNTHYYVPDGPTESYWWDGQGGGIEGLNQDTWVIVYIAQIKTAIHDIKLKYHILCKGDDFRLAVLIPKAALVTKSLKNYKEMIVNTISKKAKEFGHKIKTEESFGSARYFMFSKHASIDKIEMPESFRKIQKAYGSNNSFINTLDEYIGSTFSNSHSACRTSTTFIPQYATALFWTYYYLTNNSQYHTRSDADLVALTLVPSMCGGFPIIYLHNMPVRAESDLLPPFLDLIMHCKLYYPLIYERLKRFCIIVDEVPTSYIQLFKDPYSLPSPRPLLPSACLRKFILPVLKRLVKNEVVKELFRAMDSEEQSMCMEILDSVSHLNIKVLSRIYAATPSAIVDELTKKFESARSVLELIILRYGRRKAARILRQIMLREKQLQEWRIKVITSEDPPSGSYNFYLSCYSVCPAEFADKIRLRAWGKQVTGITNPSPYHLMSYTSSIYSTVSDVFRHFEYTITESESVRYYTKTKSRNWGDGGAEPFLGHITPTASLAPSLKFVQKDVVLGHLSDLLELYDWSRTYGSNIHLLIEQLAFLYTECPIGKLKPFQSQQKGGGTAHHHLRAKNFRAGIIPNTLTNLYTQFSGTTNTHAMIRDRRGDHFMFNFLHLYCHSHAVIFSELDIADNLSAPTVVWGVTNSCEYCNDPIREHDTPTTIKTSLLKSLRFSPLRSTHIGDVTMQVLKESLIEQRNKKFLTDENYQTISFPNACIGILQHLLSLSLDQSRAIQSRYTGHVGTDTSNRILGNLMPRSKQRDIGQTEIKNLDPNIVAPHLLIAIFHCIFSMFDVKGMVNYYQEFTHIPVTGLPWYTLMKHLYNAGTLRTMIRAMCKLSGYKTIPTESDPAVCTHVIGQMAIEAVIKNMSLVPDRLIFLHTLTPGDLKNNILRYLMCWEWATINSRFYEAYKIETQLKGVFYRPGQGIEHLAKAIVLILFKISDEVALRDISIHDLSPTMQLSDIVNIDDQDIANASDSYDLREIGGVSLKLFFQKTQIDEEAVLSYIIENKDSLVEEILDLLDNTKFSVVLASLPAAVHLIRSPPGIDDDSFNSEEVIITPIFDKMDNSIFLKPLNVRLSELTQRIPNSGIEDALLPLNAPDFTYKFTYLTDQRRIYQEFIDRSLGQVTNTFNILMSLYMFFKGSLTPRDQPLHWAELGGGYGNGSLFFSKIYRNSTGLYMSKPQKEGHSPCPELAIEEADKNNVTIHYDHCARGDWDIGNPAVMSRITASHPISNIVFMNVDKVSSFTSYEDILKETIRYYLTTRTTNGTLIMTVTTFMSNMIARLLSDLSIFCTYVYIIHPKSVRCIYSNCIVAWGTESKFDNSYELLARCNLNVYNKLHVYLNQLLDYYNNCMTVDEIRFYPIRKFHAMMSLSAPNYFRSLLLARLSIGISDDEWDSMSEENDNYLPWDKHFSRIVNQLVLPRLNAERNKIKELLSGHDSALGTVSKTLWTDDTRARRKFLLERLFIMEGLNLICMGLPREWIKNKNNVNITMPSTVFHNYFMKLCNQLHPRDKTLLPEAHSMFHKNVVIKIYDDGSKEVYNLWSRFAHGIELSLSLIGYCGSIGNMTIDYSHIDI